MRRLALFAALAAAVVVLVACGHSESATSTTPVAAATPTPTPTSTPTPAATTFACPLPASSNPQLNCGTRTPRLGDQVNLAIDSVLAKHPELFNLSDTNGGSPKVLNSVRYYNELKNELGGQGVCTKLEEEEISVKNTNDFSEDWGVLTSTGYVRRRYRGICTPAWW